MTYKHLSETNRNTIARMAYAGEPDAAIAAAVGCHRTTIHRERKRNSSDKGRRYESEAAHNRAVRRRRKASELPRKFKAETEALIANRMARGWSLDAISGREKVGSTSGLYKWAHRKQREGSHHRPVRYLVRAKAKHPPFCHMPIGLGAYKKRGKAAPPLVMAGALPIQDRPAEANDRAALGHYETDTAMVKGGTLSAVCCRATRMLFARKLAEKTADENMRAHKRMLKGRVAKTFASDRGSEHARYGLLEEHFGASWYVCQPRRPDQRGSIEGMIRQLRRWLPRSMPSEEITPAKLAGIVRRLNNIPRKSLGYKTPLEVMAKMTAAL